MTYLQEVEVDIEVVVEVSKDEITIVTGNYDSCVDREIIWIGKSMREVGDSWELVGLAKVDNGGALLQRTRKRNPWIQVAMGGDMLEGDSEAVMSRSRGCFKNTDLLKRQNGISNEGQHRRVASHVITAATLGQTYELRTG